MGASCCADHRGCGYIYDYENRLIQIYIDVNTDGDYDAGTDTNIAEFEYDALGRRIEMVAWDNSGETPTSTTTRYYYDDQRVLLETDATGTETDKRYFVYGNYIDEVLVMRDIANTDDYYYAHDHLYSAVALFDASGSVVERYEYDAYGAAHIMDASYNSRTVSSYGNPATFTGRRLDLLDPDGSGGYQLKLMDYRARTYDPQTGRFMQRDPIDYMDSLNLFEYVTSDPIVYLDATGLCKVGEYKDSYYSWQYNLGPGRLPPIFGFVHISGSFGIDGKVAMKNTCVCCSKGASAWDTKFKFSIGGYGSGTLVLGLYDAKNVGKLKYSFYLGGKGTITISGRIEGAGIFYGCQEINDDLEFCGRFNIKLEATAGGAVTVSYGRFKFMDARAELFADADTPYRVCVTCNRSGCRISKTERDEPATWSLGGRICMGFLCHEVGKSGKF